MDSTETAEVKNTHAANHLAADWGTEARNEATHFLLSHLMWAQTHELASMIMFSVLISHERR